MSNHRLSWAHYRELLRLRHAEQRKRHVSYALKPMSPDQVFKKGRHLNQELVDSGLASAI